jgi:epoxyqueuosine reductase
MKPLVKAELLQRLEQSGFATRVVAIEHLPDLQDRLTTPYRNGEFDPEFYQERLAFFTFAPPAGMPDARSIFITATRQPQVQFTFHWKEKLQPVIVPPTYLHWIESDRQVQDRLTEALQPFGHRVVPALLPKKILAACSGLVVYGRNNLTYAAGWGSFHRLAAFYSDWPCPDEDWQEPTLMGRCHSCRACQLACPTGAIDPDRFLLRADRCLSFHNEKPGPVPFPPWLETQWHNCLVGCMHCQTVCPENAHSKDWIEPGAEFSADETAQIVEGVPQDRWPAPLVEKLKTWDLWDMADDLPRNLGVLLDAYTR